MNRDIGAISIPFNSNSSLKWEFLFSMNGEQYAISSSEWTDLNSCDFVRWDYEYIVGGGHGDFAIGSSYSTIGYKSHGWSIKINARNSVTAYLGCIPGYGDSSTLFDFVPIYAYWSGDQWNTKTITNNTTPDYINCSLDWITDVYIAYLN